MARRSTEAVTSHLLADLSDDARLLLDEVPTSSQPGAGVHERLHARLSAVSRALRSTRRGVPLHAAACVLPDGRGLLIAGRTRAGKSTLVALLGGERGAAVVSDDTVWLIGADVSAIGAPLAIREASPLWDRARDLWYAEAGSRLLVRSVDLGSAPTRHHASVDVLVFPDFSVEAAPDLRTISPADAFCRLTTSLLRTCSEPELMEVALLAAQRAAVTISYADPHTALALLDKALNRVAAQPPRDVGWLDTDVLQAAGLRGDVCGIRFGDDCALWSRSLGRIAHVRGWSGETLCDTSLAPQLQALGLLRRGKATTDADPRQA